MKGFSIGLILGAAAYALGSAAYQTADKTSVQGQVAASEPSQPTLGAVGAIASGAPISSATVEQKVAGACPSTPPAPTVADCVSLFNRESQREQESRNSEPKDSLWSSASEQQLHQFIDNHALAKKFQVASIDCRTTFCEIKAFGGAEAEAHAAFQKVMEDFRQQYAFRPGASASTNDGTRLMMSQRLLRP